MVGTCVGVVILVVVLEVLRRATKEFDRWIIRRHRRAAQARANHLQQQNPPQIPPLGLGDSPAAASNPAFQAAGGEGVGAQAPKPIGTATVANVGGGDGAADDIAPAPAPAAGAGAAAASAKEEQPGQQAPEGAAAAAPARRRVLESCPLFRYLDRVGAFFRSAAAGPGGDGGVARPCRPNYWQQVVRALLHTAQFTVAYFIMLLVAAIVYPASDPEILAVWVAKCCEVRCGETIICMWTDTLLARLAMHYNGFIIISIIVGAYIGSFIFSWQILSGGEGPNTSAANDATGCCA